MEILDTQVSSHPLNSISYVIKSNDVVYCQALVRKVKVSSKIKDYIVRIANATREHPALTNGCSPRASLALMRSCQALAAYNGRDYVIPRDVREMVRIVVDTEEGTKEIQEYKASELTFKPRRKKKSDEKGKDDKNKDDKNKGEEKKDS